MTGSLRLRSMRTKTRSLLSNSKSSQEPRYGNDARGEQILAAAMRLTLVVVEEHAGRAVHLADDDTLGAVDDERAVIRHQGHVTHIDGLLLDIADGLGAGILIEVPDDQPQRHLQRGGEGHAALDALLDVVFRLFQLIVDELQPAAAGEIVDREHRLENFLQSRLGPAVRGHVHLQERFIAGPLDVDQVGHWRYFGDPAKALADALLTRKGLRDRVHANPCLLAGFCSHPGTP